MKILFFGDSITDASRARDDSANARFGAGYVVQTVAKLYEKSLTDYDVVNRGISGNRVVDLYARVKSDVWNEKPDLISILIGVNDVWHEVINFNGVELDRFDKVYRMLIDDTKKALPNAKFILCEPFVEEGNATVERYSEFLAVLDYAKTVKKIALDYGLYFLPLQKAITDASKKYGASEILHDGVHPTVKGANVIAREWMQLFNKIEKDI